jgi:hypothetical protein
VLRCELGLAMASRQASGGVDVALYMCGAPLARLNRACIESCRGREALGVVGDTFRQTLRERLTGWVHIRGCGEQGIPRARSQQHGRPVCF